MGIFNHAHDGWCWWLDFLESTSSRRRAIQNTLRLRQRTTITVFSANGDDGQARREIWKGECKKKLTMTKTIQRHAAAEMRNEERARRYFAKIHVSHYTPVFIARNSRIFICMNLSSSEEQSSGRRLLRNSSSWSGRKIFQLYTVIIKTVADSGQG